MSAAKYLESERQPLLEARPDRHFKQQCCSHQIGVLSINCRLLHRLQPEAKGHSDPKMEEVELRQSWVQKQESTFDERNDAVADEYLNICPKLLLIVLSLMLAVFCVALDNTVRLQLCRHLSNVPTPSIDHTPRLFPWRFHESPMSFTI